MRPVRISMRMMDSKRLAEAISVLNQTMMGYGLSVRTRVSKHGHDEKFIVFHRADRNVSRGLSKSSTEPGPG